MQKSTPPGDDEAQRPHCGEVNGLLRAWKVGDRAALDSLNSHRLQRTPPPRRPLHARLTPRSQPPDYSSPERSLRAVGGLQGHAVAESCAFFRGFGSVDGPHSGSRCATPQSETWERRAAFPWRRVIVGGDQSADLVALDEAMDALARLDPRKAQVVKMRFFGGLSVEKTAEVLKTSSVTVTRDWSTAEAWLLS